MLGLASFDRARKILASRITHIQVGESRKNILHFRKEKGWAVTHEEKEHIIHEHFRGIMEIPEPRGQKLN